MLQGCFKGVSNVFQRYFKDVSRKFQEYFNKNFNDFSMKIKGRLEGYLRVFPGKGVFQKVSKAFQGSVKYVLTILRLFIQIALNPLQVGVFNKPKGSGGQICPPLLYGHRRIFLLVFLDIYLEWVVKVKNPKPQVST